MTYQFTLPPMSKVPLKWQSLDDYCNDPTTWSYVAYLLRTYPECIESAHWLGINHPIMTFLTDSSLVIEFKSEEHYHWFLLQQ
jgi:hypothetical protein